MPVIVGNLFILIISGGRMETHWRSVVLTWHGWVAFLLHLGFVGVMAGLCAGVLALGVQAHIWNPFG